jgi:hypothetical protein
VPLEESADSRVLAGTAEPGHELFV